MTGRRWGCVGWLVLLLLVALVGMSPAGARAATGSDGEQAASAPGQVLPDDEVGGHPPEAYEIWYSTDGWEVGVDVNPQQPLAPVTPAVEETPSPAERITGWVTNGLFALARTLLLAGGQLVTWAYSFGLAGKLAAPAAQMAGALEAHLLGPLEVRHLAVFATVVYASWQLVRHRLGHGAGELLLTLAVLAASTWMLADPEGTFRRGVGVTAGLTGAVIELGVPADQRRDAEAAQAYIEQGYEADTSAIEPFIAGLKEAFIAGPHMLLNWGRALDGACAGAHDELLASGPHGTSDTVREQMADAGCADAAEWNAQPTWQRLFGAALVALTAAVVMGLLVLVAATVVVGQLTAVVLVGLMPLAVVGGMLPGGGRQLLWRWGVAALKTVLVMVAMAALLAFLLVITRALLDVPTDTLLERFALLAAAPIAAIVMRRKLLSAATTAASNLGGRLERRRTGGTHGGSWMRASTAGGLSGLGAAQLAQDGQADADELRRPAHTAGRRGRQAVTAAGRPFRGHGPGGGGVAGAGGERGAPSSAGRAARAVGTAGKTAAKATVGLPVSGPRGAAKTAHAAGRTTTNVRQRLDRASEASQSYGRQWRHGVTHPVRQYQRERAELARQDHGGQQP